MSRRYAEVIGDPISHSKSPMIHGFWLRKLGIDADYRACHVLPGELAAYLARRRSDAAWRGCNVTIPHKEAVARLVDARDARARAVGAVNTVVAGDQLLGTNTDVDGVADALSGIDLRGRAALVIGAGGAARSAFAFLADRDCSVRVLARSADKARRALDDCGVTGEVRPFAAGGHAFDQAAVLINATQLGMTGQPPMPGFVIDGLARMADDAMVFDMVYAPLDTQLLKAARALGRRGADGLLMLIGQAAVAFEHFFGQPPPRAHDAELRALLTA
jgi:shikimate dehydrogenase